MAKVGRKPIGKIRPFHISDKMYEDFRKFCKERGVNSSEMIRELIRFSIENKILGDEK